MFNSCLFSVLSYRFNVILCASQKTDVITWCRPMQPFSPFLEPILFWKSIVFTVPSSQTWKRRICVGVIFFSFIVVSRTRTDGKTSWVGSVHTFPSIVCFSLRQRRKWGLWKILSQSHNVERMKNLNNYDLFRIGWKNKIPVKIISLYR